MDLLLEHHQSVIHELRKTEPVSYFKELLDKIVEFLNNTANNQSDGFHILTVICEELSGLSNSKVFNNLEIMNHEFFVIVSNTFKMLFTKLTFMPLTKQDEQCLNGISLLISNLCLKNNRISTCFYTDNNEKLNPKNKEKFSLLSYEKIFFTEIFIKKFIRFLENDIVINDYDSWNIKYKILDRLIRLFIKLNDINHKLILDSVIKCVESTIYINCYKTIDLYEPKLNPKQSFFIYQCPKFIRLCSYKRQDEISTILSKSIVKYSANIFEIHLPIALEGEFIPVEKELRTEEEFIKAQKKEDNGAKSQAIAWYIEFLNYIALTPATRVSFIESKLSKFTNVEQILTGSLINLNPIKAGETYMSHFCLFLFLFRVQKLWATERFEYMIAHKSVFYPAGEGGGYGAFSPPPRLSDKITWINTVIGSSL